MAFGDAIFAADTASDPDAGRRRRSQRDSALQIAERARGSPFRAGDAGSGFGVAIAGRIL
jgi:hypothetical protein